MSVLVLTSQTTYHSIKFQIKKRRLCTFLRSLGNDGYVNLTIKGGKISARVAYLKHEWREATNGTICTKDTADCCPPRA